MSKVGYKINTSLTLSFLLILGVGHSLVKRETFLKMSKDNLHRRKTDHDGHYTYCTILSWRIVPAEGFLSDFANNVNITIYIYIYSWIKIEFVYWSTINWQWCFKCYIEYHELDIQVLLKNTVCRKDSIFSIDEQFERK